MSSLERLPTEILHDICQDVALFGSSDLVGLTTASHRLHGVSNPILYATDLQESGGVKSMCFGLASRQHRVVKLCLTAEVRPDLRIESRHDLESSHDFESMLLSELRDKDALEFSKWLSDRLDIAPDDRRSSEQRPDRRALYTDVRRDGNKPFQSVEAFYWTPLHVAALRNDVELLAILLDHGANPNSAGRGVCPCYYQRLRRTYNHSVPPERQDHVGMLERRLVTRWSPLHVAVCKGNFACAEYLLNGFGLPHATDSDPDVMEEAQRFYREEPVLADLARIEPDAVSRLTPRFDPLPPLHVAVEKYASLQDLEKLHALLKGPYSDVDALDAFGDKPFAVAAFSGRAETFGPWLRDRGADVDFELLDLNRIRRSVLNALCQSGQHKDALSLVDLGVDVNREAELHRGVRFESALHLCCGWRRVTGEWPAEEKLQKQQEAASLLERLVHAGADVGVTAENGITPLMSAAALHFTAAIRVLLEGNPDVEAKDDQGRSAIDYAIARGLGNGTEPQISAALFAIHLLLDSVADRNPQCADRSAPPRVIGVRDIGDPSVPYPTTFPPSLCGRTLGGVLGAMAPTASPLVDSGLKPNACLDQTRDCQDGVGLQRSILKGHSLILTALYAGEFACMDSLVASGTLVSDQDFIPMMRPLDDMKLQSRGSESVAVQWLFRVLNRPLSHLRRLIDGEKFLDAWAELLHLSVRERPKHVRALAPYLGLFSMATNRGPGGKTAVHLYAKWVRNDEGTAEFRQRVGELIADLICHGASRRNVQPEDNRGLQFDALNRHATRKSDR